MKLGFNIWHAFISTEYWIRFVHKSARRNIIELYKHWCCLTLMGIFMCASKYWIMTEDDLRKATITDQPSDRPTDRQTNIVTYQAAIAA